MAASVYPSLHNWLTGCLDYCTETNQIRVRNFAAAESDLIQLQQELDTLNYAIAYIDAGQMQHYLQIYQDLATELGSIYYARTWLNHNMHELSQLYRQRQLQPHHLVTLQNWCSQAQIPNLQAYSQQGQQLLAGTRTSHWRIPELIHNQLELITCLPTSANSSNAQESPNIFNGLIQRGQQVQLNSMPYVSRGYLRYPQASPAQSFNLSNELLAGTIEELNVLSHRLLTARVLSSCSQPDPILELYQAARATTEAQLENQVLLLQAYDQLNQLCPQGFTPQLDREQITQQYQELQQRRAQESATHSASTEQASTPAEQVVTPLRCYPFAPWEQNPAQVQFSYLNWQGANSLVQAYDARWERDALLSQNLGSYTYSSSCATLELTAANNYELASEFSHTPAASTPTRAIISTSTNTTPESKEFPFRGSAHLKLQSSLKLGTELAQSWSSSIHGATIASYKPKISTELELNTPLLTPSLSLEQDILQFFLYSLALTGSTRQAPTPEPEQNWATASCYSNQDSLRASLAPVKLPSFQPHRVNGFGTLVQNGTISNSRLLAPAHDNTSASSTSSSQTQELAPTTSQIGVAEPDSTSWAQTELDHTLAQSSELGTALELPTLSEPTALNLDYLNLDFSSGRYNPTHLGGIINSSLPELSSETWQEVPLLDACWSMPWLEEPDLNKRAQLALQECFGYGEFRGLQQQVISHILNGEDVLAIMATGAGKSLCYQIPALCQPGCALVVSPLIALMEDQVQQLLARGIPAAYITSKNSQDTLAILEQVRSGKLKFLYIAPERAVSNYFLRIINSLPINLIAIDEAHCVINWGHNFRPDYIDLHKIRENMHRQVPVLACTATARRDTRLGIIEKLALRKSAMTQEHNIIVGDFNRRNIEINVINFSNVGEKKAFFNKLVAKCNKPAIVYCHGRNTVETVTQQLCAELDLKATMYHAGLNIEQRDKNQHEFLNGDYEVIVATIAFGMGIDKSDIRTIIHYDYPSSLESYYQEIGRAGRDGAPSRAYLLSDTSSQAFRKRIIVQQAKHDHYQYQLNPSHDDPELVSIIRGFTHEQISNAIDMGIPLRELARQEYETSQRNLNQQQAQDLQGQAAHSLAQQATPAEPHASQSTSSDLHQCYLDRADLPELPLYERPELPLEMFKLSEELAPEVMTLALTLQQTAQQLSYEHFLQLGKQLFAQPSYARLLKQLPELKELIRHIPERDGLEATLAQLPGSLRDQLAQIFTRVAQLLRATARIRAQVQLEYRNGNPYHEPHARAQTGNNTADASQARATSLFHGWTLTPAQLIAFLHAQQVYTRCQQQAQATRFAPSSSSNEEIQFYWNLLLRALLNCLQHLAAQLESCLSQPQLLAQLKLDAPGMQALLASCSAYRAIPLTLHPHEVELSHELLQNLRNYITEAQFRSYTTSGKRLALSQALWYFGGNLNLWQTNLADHYLPFLARQVLKHNFARQILRSQQGMPLYQVEQIGTLALEQLPADSSQALAALKASGWQLGDVAQLTPTQPLTTTQIANLEAGLCQFSSAQQQRLTVNLLAGWHLASQQEFLTRLPWDEQISSTWYQPRLDLSLAQGRKRQQAPLMGIQIDPYTGYLMAQAALEQQGTPSLQEELGYAEFSDDQDPAALHSHSFCSAATIFTNPAYLSEYWSVSPTSCLYLEMAQQLYQEYRVASQQAKQTANVVSQNVKLTPQETMELNLNYLNEVFNFAKSSNCRRKVLLAVFGQELKQDCQHCDTCREKSPAVDLSYDLFYVIILTTLLQGKAIRPMLLNILTGQDKQYFVENSAAVLALGIPFAQLKQAQPSISKIARRTFRYARQYWSQVLDYALELGYIAKDNLKGYLSATPAGRELVNARQPVRIRTKTSLDKRDIYLEALRNDLTLVFKNLHLRHTLSQQSLEALAKKIPTTKEELAQIPGFTTQLIETRKAGAYILKTLQLYCHRLAQRNPLLRASEIK